MVQKPLIPRQTTSHLNQRVPGVRYICQRSAGTRLDLKLLRFVRLDDTLHRYEILGHGYSLQFSWISWSRCSDGLWQPRRSSKKSRPQPLQSPSPSVENHGRSLLRYAEVPIPWQQGWRVSSADDPWNSRPAMTATSGIASRDLRCSALEAWLFSSVGIG